MSFRILADENVDHRVVHRLDNYGHDVEHVDFVESLGKGAADGSIARHSLATDRLLLTNDDDFLTEFDDGAYRGLLFVEDDALAVGTVADIVHAISEVVDQRDVDGVLYVSETWLYPASRLARRTSSASPGRQSTREQRFPTPAPTPRP